MVVEEINYSSPTWNYFIQVGLNFSPLSKPSGICLSYFNLFDLVPFNVYH